MPGIDESYDESVILGEPRELTLSEIVQHIRDNGKNGWKDRGEELINSYTSQKCEQQRDLCGDNYMGLVLSNSESNKKETKGEILRHILNAPQPLTQSSPSEDV